MGVRTKPNGVSMEEWEAYIRDMGRRKSIVLEGEDDMDEHDQYYDHLKRKPEDRKEIEYSKKKPSILSNDEWISYVNDLNAELERKGSNFRYALREEYTRSIDQTSDLD